MGIVLKEIIGTPDNEGWVQIHHFSGLEAEKKQKRGEMVLLLSLKGASEEAATGYGREIISRVYEEYYGNLSETPMERVKEMLTKIGKERPVYLTERISLSLLVSVYWQGFVYLGVWGSGEFFLLKKGELVPLLSGEGQRSSVISGKVSEADLLIFGTQNFFSQIPQGTIRASLQGNDPQVAAEVLSPLVHARVDQSQIGAALVKIGLEQIEKRVETKTVIEPEAGPIAFSNPRIRSKREFKLKFPQIPFSKTKLNLGLGLIILAGLFVLIGGGVYRRQKLGKEKEFSSLVSEAENKLKTAETIYQLKAEESLGLIGQVEELITKAQEINPSSTFLESLQKRAENLTVLLGKGDKIRPELFFKLSLLAEEARGEQMSITEKELFVFDPQTQKVFSFQYPDKHSQTFLGGEIVQDKLLFSAQKANSFYLLDEKGIVFWDGKGGSERVVEHQWQEPFSLLSWGSNFYVLDKGEKKLFKLVGLGKSYSSPKDWFATTPELSWGEIVDLAIDGNIWFLSKSGQITKFFKGREVSFKLENNPQKESSLLALSADGSRLVVLTTENQVLVWNKEGAWQGQINLDLTNAIDLAISPNGQWLFILTKGEVYYLDLNEALL